LSLEKVRKTAVVKMDLQRTHVEAGLIHRRGKRKLGTNFEPEENPTVTLATALPMSSTPGGVEDPEDDDDEEPDQDNGDEQDISDFDELAEKLIANAEADSDNDNDDDGDDGGNDGEATAASNDSCVAPTTSTSSSLTIRIPPRKTLVPLKDLFIYPEDLAAHSDLDFYWRSGIAKLEDTVAAYELLSQSPA
jgi:hypothetical protein